MQTTPTPPSLTLLIGACIFSVTLLASSSRADVLPLPANHGVSILPRSAGSTKESFGRGELTSIRGPFAHTQHDVRLIRQDIHLLLTPSFFQVETLYRFRAGGQKTGPFLVGFPTQWGRYRGLPLRGFELQIDGKAHQAQRQEWDARKPAPESEPPSDLLALATLHESPDVFGRQIGQESWWIWSMEFAPDQERHVRVRHLQRFGRSLPHPQPRGVLYYILTTASAWRSSVGQTNLTLTLRGVPRHALSIIWDGQSQPPQSPDQPRGEADHFVDNGEQLHWSFHNNEPRTNLAIHYRLTENDLPSWQGFPSTYLPQDTPLRLQLFDLISYIPSEHHPQTQQEMNPDQLEALLLQLELALQRALRSPDPCTRHYGLRILTALIAEDCQLPIPLNTTQDVERTTNDSPLNSTEERSTMLHEDFELLERLRPASTAWTPEHQARLRHDCLPTLQRMIPKPELLPTCTSPLHSAHESPLSASAAPRLTSRLRQRSNTRRWLISLLSLLAGALLLILLKPRRAD